MVYQYLKINGMCVTCGRKTNGERVRCEVCYEKYNRKRLKPKEQKIKPLTIYCNKCKNNIVKHNGLCDKCYEEVVIPNYLRGNRKCQTKKLIMVI